MGLFREWAGGSGCRRLRVFLAASLPTCWGGVGRHQEQQLQ